MNTRRFLVIAVIFIGLFIASEAFAQGNVPARPPFFAVLLGGNEIDPVTHAANDGDPNGVGSATILIDGDRLCFGIIVNNLDAPTAAHIHRGVAGTNGPVVVPLIRPVTGDPGTSSGCVTVADSALLSTIRSNPGLFYVNVHTTAFLGGAIRGQLF